MYTYVEVGMITTFGVIHEIFQTTRTNLKYSQ